MISTKNHIYTCFTVHNSPEPYPIDIAVTLKNYNSNLGEGEQAGGRTGGGKAAEQEPQRESRRVAGASKKKSSIINLIAFFSDF